MFSSKKDSATGDYDLLFKIVLAGDADVGKTSLLARYVKGTFSESYQSTIGVDFQARKE